MQPRSHLSRAERDARSRLAQSLLNRPLLRGSLVTVRRVCGKPNCRCTRGDRHECLCLSIRVGDRRKMIYLPKAWEETIRSWVAGYREIATRIDAVSQACLDRFLREKKAGRAPDGPRRRPRTRRTR